ncbi:hypothetical protein CMQ_4015 [Grosmannia clavigera kw1407]|uniref:Uncharacterized protein n=1 Tax=Grosmannia clavigera (strain kw1407 / UAMH 11150) TaxID=655863 RepID=F0X9M4_GROCL|nr:uncharacterized protein CMQ_4015 [Grosmannia clavigera kw1407]EFX05946.1 hypothetical protein CMQ_4015 [Grosmannia clavigera kw1407]
MAGFVDALKNLKTKFKAIFKKKEAKPAEETPATEAAAEAAPAETAEAAEPADEAKPAETPAAAPAS